MALQQGAVQTSDRDTGERVRCKDAHGDSEDEMQNKVIAAVPPLWSRQAPPASPSPETASPDRRKIPTAFIRLRRTPTARTKYYESTTKDRRRHGRVIPGPWPPFRRFGIAQLLLFGRNCRHLGLTVLTQTRPRFEYL